MTAKEIAEACDTVAAALTYPDVRRELERHGLTLEQIDKVVGIVDTVALVYGAQPRRRTQ